MYKLASIALLCVLTLGLLAADTPAPAPVVQSEAGKKSLTRIRQLGGLALEVAQNDQHLEVSYLQLDGKWTDEPLALLKDLKGVVHLNLRSQPVTDEQLAHLKPLTELTHLHLEKTKITDKGLESLKPLVNLEYLNLYGTAVSDTGLTSLEGMKKLKKLYVWDTKVTAAGAAKLKKAVPGLDVNLGIEDKPEPKKEEKKPAPKKEEKKPAPKKEEKKDKKPEPKKEEKKPEPKKEEKKPQPKKEEKKPEPKKEEKKDKKPEATKDATKTADEMTTILKVRVALAERAHRAAWEGLSRTQRIGNVLMKVTEKPEEVYIWSVRWLQAQRDLSPKHEDQVAALEAHLKRMTDLKKGVEEISRDLMPRIRVDEVEWYRLEAQLWLMKAKQAKDKQASAK
jgi:hypothetical protein